MKNLDYDNMKEIKSQLKKSDSSLVQDVFDMPKTKVYLINEFDLQGVPYIVVIVRRCDFISSEYDDKFCVWNKQNALKESEDK